MKTFRFIGLHVPSGGWTEYTQDFTNAEAFTRQLATWNYSPDFWVYFPLTNENLRLVNNDISNTIITENKQMVNEGNYVTGITHSEALEIKWEKDKLGI